MRPIQSPVHYLGTDAHNVMCLAAQHQNKRGFQTLCSFAVKSLRNKSEFGFWLSFRREKYFDKSILQAAGVGEVGVEEGEKAFDRECGHKARSCT